MKCSSLSHALRPSHWEGHGMLQYDAVWATEAHLCKQQWLTKWLWVNKAHILQHVPQHNYESNGVYMYVWVCITSHKNHDCKAHILQHALHYTRERANHLADLYACASWAMCGCIYMCVTSSRTLQHTATHYNTRQQTATHCNTLQHTATHCNTL